MLFACSSQISWCTFANYISRLSQQNGAHGRHDISYMLRPVSHSSMPRIVRLTCVSNVQKANGLNYHTVAMCISVLVAILLRALPPSLLCHLDTYSESDEVGEGVFFFRLRLPANMPEMSVCPFSAFSSFFRAFSA